jgi:NDP-sugar pyrophosphorylase family protein
VLLPNTRRERFSVVKTEGGHVKAFGGMPVDEAPVPLMFTGIQILEPRIFEYVPRGVFSHSTTDVYPQAIANGEVVAAHVASGKWRELSTLRRYLDISVELLKEEGKSFVAGSQTVIAPSATITDSILWDDVEVGAGARVTRAILADDVKLKAGEIVENAVVVPRQLVDGKKPPEKALPGHFRGENFIVPL